MPLYGAEKADLVLKLVFIVPLTLGINVLESCYLAVRRGLVLKDYLIVAILRTFLTCLSPRQIVAVSPSTEATFSSWWTQTQAFSANQNSALRATPVTEVVADGARIHWIQPPSHRSEVVLFFHGGGYNAPLSTGHMNWCAAIVRHSLKANRTVAVAILEYGLTPDNRYPLQLRQARNALEHLLKSGITPENVIIGGDSAGGHLALSLLSHLLHPHPQCELLSLQAPLAGAFLISPWVTDKTESESFRWNARIDMLSSNLVRRSTGDFVASSELEAERVRGHGWAMPMQAGPGWWEGLGGVVTSLYITAGEQELFRDHIVEFGNHLRTELSLVGGEMPAVQLHVDPGEAHDHILVSCLQGQMDTPSMKRLVRWMKRAWNT